MNKEKTLFRTVGNVFVLGLLTAGAFIAIKIAKEAGTRFADVVSDDFKKAV